MPLVILLIIAAAAAFGASHVRIPGCGGVDRAAYKPDKVIVACGDGNFYGLIGNPPVPALEE